MAALGLLIAALTPDAHALETEETRAQARTLGYAGVRAYGAGDYAAASQQLEASYELLPVPSLGLWSARAPVKLGKWLAAEQRYRQVTATQLDPSAPAVQHAAWRTAELELAELEPRIPRLRVRVVDAGGGPVRVTVDGAAIDGANLGAPRRVDPGPHEVVGHCGAERSAVSLSLEEGQERDAVLRFSGCAALAASPLDAPAPTDPWRVPAWVAIGVGGASLAASGVAYFLAKHEYDALEAEGSCVDERCRPDADLDAYNTFRTLHLATLVTGVILGAAGVTILVLDPGAPASTSTGSGMPLQIGASLRTRF